MSLDCKHLEDKLLDLAYGELPDDEAEALRMHAADCPICREALESFMLTRKLAQRLPEVDEDDLDADFDDHIFAMATRQAGDFADQDDQHVDNVTPLIKPSMEAARRKTSLSSLLAVAAVATLIFGATLFLAQEGTVSDSEPPSKVAVAETHKAENPIGGSKKNEPSSSPQKAKEEFSQAPTSPKYAPAQVASKKRGSSPNKQKARTEDLSSEKAPIAGRGSGGQSPMGNLGTSAGESRKAPKRDNAPNPAFSRKPAEDKDKPSEMYDESLDDFELDGVPVVQEESRGVLPEQKKESPKPLSNMQNSASDFDQGLDAYTRGDCEAATFLLLPMAQLTPANPTKTPKAIHHIARCDKRRGRCGRALPWYDKLLSDFTDYRGRADALWEAAACHRKLGHISKARSLLETLTLIPGWQIRAKNELERLNSQN